MKKSALVLFVYAGLVLGGCAFFQPGQEGDKTRQQVHDVIESVVPAPWGAILATASTALGGGVAAWKSRAASQANDKAEAAMDAARSTITGIETVYQTYKAKAANGGTDAEKAEAAKMIATLKDVKSKAKETSVALKVPDIFEEIVARVAPKPAPGGV